MLPAGVRRLFRLPTSPKRVAREVDDELRFHLDEKTEALVRTGWEPAAARAEAERQFGDVRRARETLVRLGTALAERRTRAEWWEGALADLKTALRGMMRSPGVTATVVVMLGLGIGGAAAMYGLLDRLLLRVGPGIEAPGELRRLYINSYNRLEGIRASTPWLDAEQIVGLQKAWGLPVASAASWTAGLGGPAGERIPIAMVSGSYFAVLGARPARGRRLATVDDQAGAAPAAVISYGLWRRAFAGDRSALGRTLIVDSLHLTIVGVAAPGFSGLSPDRVDAWVPMQVAGPALIGNGLNWNQSLAGFDAVVRLTGASRPEQLSSEAWGVYRSHRTAGELILTSDIGGPGDSAISAQLAPVNPGARPGALSDTVRLSLIVGGLALMLCLIAVANATNLLLLRAVRRRRETAVRLALGVSRGRLVRLGLIESMIVALGGAGAAMLFATWSGVVLQKLIVRQEWQRGIVDARVLAVATVIGLLIGVVTGLVPGWQASRPEAIAALKSGARSEGAPSRLRSGLVALQAALTLLLLVGSALYLRSFLHARDVDFVVAADHLVSVDLERAAGRPDARGVSTDVVQQIAADVRRVPGVAAIARATIAPIYGMGGSPLRIEGVASFAVGMHGPFYSEVDSAFFGVAGLPLRRGRGFTQADVSAAAPVAIVNDAFAQRFWPGQNAIGKCLYIAWSGAADASACRQVVGVVSHYRLRVDDDEPSLSYYVPLGDRWNDGTRALVVRTSAPAQDVEGGIARVVRARLPDAAPEAVMALSDITSSELDPWRSGTTLFALFAGLAVILATGGLYAVVAFSVAQRRREMAIRVAIGAPAKELARLVLRMALRPVTLGLLIGLGLALWLVRFIAPLLFHTTARDPVALGAAVAALFVAAGLACIGPAASAIGADPREALQAE